MSDPTQNPPPEEPSASTPPPPPSGGYQPAPPTPPAPSGIGQPADLLMRFLARLIDGILIAIVNYIIDIALVGAIINSNGGTMGGFGSYSAYAAVTSIITAVLYYGYFVLLESRDGKTVGKMLLKMQTQGPDGGTPTLEAAAKRNAWAALSILGVVPFLGILGSLGELVAVIMIAVTISSSPINEGWHDRFAGGTKVIKTG